MWADGLAAATRQAEAASEGQRYRVLSIRHRLATAREAEAPSEARWSSVGKFSHRWAAELTSTASDLPANNIHAQVVTGCPWGALSFDNHIAWATVTRRVSLAVMTQAYSQETCSRINEPPTGTTRNGTGPLRTSSFQATAHDAPRALCGLPRQSLKGISILAQGSHRRWIPWVPAPQASQS